MMRDRKKNVSDIDRTYLPIIKHIEGKLKPSMFSRFKKYLYQKENYLDKYYKNIQSKKQFYTLITSLKREENIKLFASLTLLLSKCVDINFIRNKTYFKLINKILYNNLDDVGVYKMLQKNYRRMKGGGSDLKLKINKKGEIEFIPQELNDNNKDILKNIGKAKFSRVYMHSQQISRRILDHLQYNPNTNIKIDNILDYGWENVI